jgi:hypothetical protein
MSLGLRIGAGCESIMDEKMINLPCRNIEVDEIWGFIGKKQKNVKSRDSRTLGDVWTWIALDADTKLIPCFVVGQHNNFTGTGGGVRIEFKPSRLAIAARGRPIAFSSATPADIPMGHTCSPSRRKAGTVARRYSLRASPDYDRQETASPTPRY